MLGCTLVQQGHRKALALGGHLQEHIVDHDKHLVDQDDHLVDQLHLLVFLVEVLYCIGVVLRLQGILQTSLPLEER